MRKIGVGLALLLVAPVFGQEAEAGRKAYLSFCANCHGAQGLGGRGPSLAQPLSRAPDDEALTRVILQGIPGSEMPPTRLIEQEVRDLIAYVRLLAREPAVQVAGNADNGKALYEQQGCAQCHAIAGEGGRLGPDLTQIGQSRSFAYLRRALLEPAAELPERFAQYRLIIPMPDNFLVVRAETRDGKTVTGVRLNEDPFTIQIRDFSGGFHSLDKSDLKDLEKQYGYSPMPSYNNLLTSEIEDLVGYLLSLRGAS
jgi:putative heme-binding domain-containing protein